MNVLCSLLLSLCCVATRIRKVLDIMYRCSAAGLQGVTSTSRQEAAESGDQLEGLSYAEQYDRIFSKDIDAKKV
jgi:hypothetical protein